MPKRRKSVKWSVKGEKRPIEFDRAVFPRNVQWMHDFDYLDKLGPIERAWMAKFIKEYINGNVKKHDRWALHRTQRLRRDCYARKNAQNRDLMSVLNAGNKMDRVNNETDKTEKRPGLHFPIDDETDNG